MANVNFNSVELANYSLVIPKVQGFHDLAGLVVKESYVPGYALPNESTLRDEVISFALDCVMESELSHANLVSKLNVIKGYVSPRLGWKYLTVTDITNKRTLARFDGFPVRIDALPWDQTVIEFRLTGRRAPWWEDVTAQTDTSIASGDVVANSGTLPCYPVWTLTSTDANASGVTLTIGASEFHWDAAFPSGHVLTVETELPIVKYDGTANYAGVADDCEFPHLAVGNNTVTFTGNMTVAASWHRRYE